VGTAVGVNARRTGVVLVSGARSASGVLGGNARTAGGTIAGGASTASGALVAGVGTLADRAVDAALLGGERVQSAAEAKRLLGGEADTEALAGEIQRVVVLAGPFVRRLLLGAKATRVPWLMLASSAVSIGIGVRTGVRELQLLASLLAHRIEQATGAPAEPALVKKLAIDLYLQPTRRPDPADSRLRLVRLTRKWVLSGAFGRKSSRRAGRAFTAAERLDAAELAACWREAHPGADAPPSPLDTRG
jgi:hypothetical protein